MTVPIGPRTQLCGVILHPAEHTRSPAMHNAAFAALGVDAVYLAFDVEPAGLEMALAGARALGVRQLAVSIPHKEAVMAHLDAVDATSRRIGAVNTITREGDATTSARTATGWASYGHWSARPNSPDGGRWYSAPAARHAPRSSGCSNAARAYTF